MAIQSLYPSIAPSLNLDFANTKALDPRISFSRASEARFYDGRTVAKAEENLLLRSQEFDNESWAKTNTTVTTNGANAPDGTATAEVLTATGANATTLQTVTTIAGDYTFSVWIRRVSGTGNVDITANSGGTWVTQAITTSWARYIVTQTLTAGSRTPGIRIATSGDVVEVWGAQLEQRSSVTAYTPTTDQPITNYIPVLQTAAANVARFDHNPVTGESMGLLVEEQRTNLLVDSGTLSSVSFNGGTRTANQLVAPDGTQTASVITGNARAPAVYVQSTTATATTLTFSCYVKTGLVSSRTSFIFLMRNSTTGTDFNTGTFSTTTGAISGAGWTSTSVGNGWFRISYTNTQSQVISAGDTITCYFGATGGPLYQPTDAIGLWGAQLENGTFPTSYIPTVASQVTRSADAASMTGANFSSWYRADEGTLYGDARIYATTADGPVLFGISDGTSNNAFYGGQTAPSEVRPLAVRANSANQALNSVSLTVPVNYSYKFAGAYRTNSIGGAVNGTAVAEDTTALVPQVNQAAIGGLTSSLQRVSGHIRKLVYYPARLSNAQLQALTT